MARFVAPTDPQPVHGAPVVHASAWHAPLRLTSDTNVPRPGPPPVIDTPNQRRGHRRLVRPVKGTS